MQTELPAGWKRKPVRSMLVESRLAGSNGKEAQKLTVKLYGKGVLAKDEKSLGSEATRYFTRRRGQFIYSRLDFLNGAFGIIPDQLDGRESTADLPAFDFLDEVEPKWFLEYVSRPSFYEKSGLGAIGSRKAKRVSPEEFLRIEVATPPLPEQKKIAEILGSVDEAIRATEAVIEQTRRVKEGLLQELLTKGIGHTKFKQTEIGEIPEGWEVSTVGRACRIHNSPRKPIKVEDRRAMPGPYPYWGPTKVLDFIDEYNFEGEYALIGEDGDHFLKWDRWEMTKWATGRFNVNNHAHVIGSTEKCAARWFYYYFLHRDLTQGLTRQGANRYKLTKAGLIDLPILLPPVQEQMAIVGTMDGILAPLTASLSALEQLRSLKSGLLQDLLTGKVRVKP